MTPGPLGSTSGSPVAITAPIGYRSSWTEARLIQIDHVQNVVWSAPWCLDETCGPCDNRDCGRTASDELAWQQRIGDSGISPSRSSTVLCGCVPHRRARARHLRSAEREKKTPLSGSAEKSTARFDLIHYPSDSMLVGRQSYFGCPVERVQHNRHCKLGNAFPVICQCRSAGSRPDSSLFHILILEQAKAEHAKLK